MDGPPGSYILITPLRNEAATLRRTVASVAAQTNPPRRWVAVDDGSTDRSAELLHAASRELPFLTVVTRPDRGFDAVGGGVVEAFAAGLAALAGETARYLGKLDADIEVGRDYFARLAERMDADPRLGIASGQNYLRDARGRLRVEPHAAFHPVGGARLYRWSVFTAIGGLVASPGWDSLDVLRAGRLGYDTRNYPDLEAIHLRPMGTRGELREAVLRQGRVSHLLGYSPLYLAARMAAHALRSPVPRRAWWLLRGYLGARRAAEPRIATPEEVSWLRRSQLRRLLGLGPPPPEGDGSFGAKR